MNTVKLNIYSAAFYLILKRFITGPMNIVNEKSVDFDE